MTIIQNIRGQQQIVSTIISGKVSHKVTAVKDSIYELEVVYESLAMNLIIGDKNIIDVNSDDKDKQDMISKIFSSILHKAITVVINKGGKVLEIRNSDNLYSGMFDNFPQLTEAQKAQFKNQLQQSFGDNAFKASFQDAFAMFPNTAVGVNDKWVTTTTMESVILAAITTNYAMKDITNDMFIIHGDATIHSTGDAGYKEINGMPMRVDNVNGTSSADYKVNKTTGWITYARVTKDLKADMVIKDNPKTPGGITILVVANIAFTMSNK
jgi:hypothetical protein